MSETITGGQGNIDLGVRTPVRRPQAPRLRLINCDEPEWDEWLALTGHDVYHRAAYHRLAEQQGEGRAFLAIFGSPARFFAWPYLLREISASARHVDLTDVTSVYGYAGPLARNLDGDPAFTRQAWAAIRGGWLRQGAVSAFTRFHPLFANQRLLAHYGGVTEIGPTVSIDVTTADEVAVHAYPRVLRQEIAAARRRGLHTERDQSWEHLPAFAALYDLTMHRVGAAGRYFYPAEHFENLRDVLAENAHLFVTRLAGRVVAAGVFLEHADMLHAHLVGTDPMLRDVSPLKVLLDDVRRWGHERGSRLLHLGGGLGGHADSLLAFKGRFSPHRHPFAIGRWVLDERNYRRLTVERRQVVLRAGAEWEPSFFPSYRA